MHADVTISADALEAVREGGAVLDESISGFLEDGRVPPYRLHVFREQPKGLVHESEARRWFRERRESGGVPGGMAPFDMDAAARALSDGFLHASPGARAVFGQDGAEGLDPEDGQLWLLKKLSGRKRVLGEDGWKDGEEAFWLNVELLWTFAPKAVDVAVRRALDGGLAVYDPQEDRLYRRVQALCRDVRWRCHAMAEELCALARRTSPFVERIVQIEEMDSGGSSASASYAVVIRGGDGAGTLRKRLRAFCKDFEAELERQARGGRPSGRWNERSLGLSDRKILHCGRSLSFLDGTAYAVSFSIEGYAEGEALTVHMDNGKAVFPSETYDPGPLSVEPLGRPRIADLLKEARELAGEQGLQAHLFARLHSRRMKMRRPGMADRLAYSVEVERKMRELGVCSWSTWGASWSGCVAVCDRTSLDGERAGDDCLLFDEYSIGVLYPSLEMALPGGFEVFSYLNPFTVQGACLVAEDMKRRRDCIRSGEQTPELQDLMERFERFDRRDAGMPDRESLLWFLDFMIKWFGEFPDGTQDRFYNIRGL